MLSTNRTVQVTAIAGAKTVAITGILCAPVSLSNEWFPCEKSFSSKDMTIPGQETMGRYIKDRLNNPRRNKSLQIVSYEALTLRRTERKP